MNQPRKLKPRGGRPERRARVAARPMVGDGHGAAQALLELTCTAKGEWDASIRHIVRFDAEEIRVERVSYWSVPEDAASMHCEAGYNARSGMVERGATLLKSRHTEYFDAILKAQILDVTDVRADFRITRELRAYCAAHGISSKLDIPVWVDGRLAGVLCHEHVGAKRQWSEGDADFAVGVAQVVASALAVRAQTHAEAASQRVGFLDRVSGLILQSLDVHQLATLVLGLVVPKLADCAIVWVLNRDDALECVGSTHIDARLNDVVVELMRSARTAGLPLLSNDVVRQSQSLLLSNASPAALKRAGFDAAQRGHLAKLGVRTAMAVPLALAGKTFGAMALLAAGRSFRSEDLSLAEDVGERVATALQSVRRYEIARDALRARDDLLMLASHELRTPLAALQLTCDRLLRLGPHEGCAEEASARDAIARQVRRLSALVEHMIDALRIRAEGVALVLEPCDLATIVEDCVKRVAERARRAGCPMKVSAESAVLGRWDRARVAQVIDALLDNAIKFGAGNTIQVRVEHEGTNAVLTVRDHGCGIARDRLVSVFAPFERYVPKEHFGGLGLGLYIAKAIAEAHGGSIAATSEPDEGTALVVRLPVAEPRREAS